MSMSMCMCTVHVHVHVPTHALHVCRILSAATLLNYNGHRAGVATVIYCEQGTDLVANRKGYAMQRSVRCTLHTPRHRAQALA
jgi:hypothetical protein